MEGEVRVMEREKRKGILSGGTEFSKCYAQNKKSHSLRRNMRDLIGIILSYLLHPLSL